MLYLIVVAVLLLLLLGPQLWVRHVFARYNRVDEENFPGNGGELARHLLDRFSLSEVSVEATDQGDHYDPQSKSVRLTQDKLSGRTLTAITTAAHEVGHALQDAANERMFRTRNRLAGFAIMAQEVGSFLLFTAPVLTVVTRTPYAGIISGLAAFLVLGSNILVQAVTLPVEFDASFKKALPLLKSGYLTDQQQVGAKRILRAAALTYLAASLAGLLNFWQWIRVFRH
ncbi:MAG: zinc metallopeptidase [Candidatus Thiodiazotropha sp.]